MPTRSQLTLFVPDPAARAVEAVRARLDPVQAGLIAAHVTLCREDELAGLDIDTLQERLRHFGAGALTLRFGPPQPFDGHGLLLPCTEGQPLFQALRCGVLGSASARPHGAHLTLAHPRNPPRADPSARDAAAGLAGLTLTFSVISWIRQEGTAAWQRISDHPLPEVPPRPR